MVAKSARKLTSRTAALRAASFAAEKQAVDIVVLDLRKVTDFCDFFVICSGVVDVHVRAIFKFIEEELIKVGWKPKHIEGTENLRWVLMDYVDVIIHVFQSDVRGYYSLERLWGDAPRLKVKGLP